MPKSTPSGAFALRPTSAPFRSFSFVGVFFKTASELLRSPPDYKKGSACSICRTSWLHPCMNERRLGLISISGGKPSSAPAPAIISPRLRGNSTLESATAGSCLGALAGRSPNISPTLPRVPIKASCRPVAATMYFGTSAYFIRSQVYDGSGRCPAKPETFPSEANPLRNVSDKFTLVAAPSGSSPWTALSQGEKFSCGPPHEPNRTFREADCMAATSSSRSASDSKREANRFAAAGEEKFGAGFISSEKTFPKAILSSSEMLLNWA